MRQTLFRTFISVALLLGVAGAGPCDKQVPIGVTKDAGQGDASTCDGACASSADVAAKACIESCRQPVAPNYGGFELYEYSACYGSCPVCSGLSPCGGNDTPLAGAACLSCLQNQLAVAIEPGCSGNAGCTTFAKCMQACPTTLGKQCTASCDGTSTCEPGQYCPASCVTCPCTDTCRAQTYVCTLGQDQTCNDDPAISSIQGSCIASDGPNATSCQCATGFSKNPQTGKCR